MLVNPRPEGFGKGSTFSEAVNSSLLAKPRSFKNSLNGINKLGFVNAASNSCEVPSVEGLPEVVLVCS